MDLFGNLPLLQAANQGGQLFTTFITFGLVILIFYFMIIRPQNKKQKDAAKMLEALKRGDKVVTIGGIRGVIHSVKEQTIVLKVDENVKIEFSKSAVSALAEPKDAKSDKKDGKPDKASKTKVEPEPEIEPETEPEPETKSEEKS